MNQSGPPDLITLKEQLETTWSAGDYGRVAEGLSAGAEAFLARLAIEPGTRMLDVACGTGQLAIPAARAGARVTGIDLAANWIEQARRRAASEGDDVRFDVGDVEDLPYAEASFDLVVSLIGAMFAPRPQRVVAELLRVARRGGQVVMGNWTPESFVGDFFRTLARHVPPPDMPSPLLWGDEATVKERLSKGVEDLQLNRLPYQFYYPYAPEDVVNFYAGHFGPVMQALASLDPGGQAALKADLAQLWSRHNRATDGSTEVTGEILEVVAIRA